MPDQNTFDNDAESKSWRDERHANAEDEVSASVTFMEIMRQAAARAAHEADPSDGAPESASFVQYASTPPAVPPPAGNDDEGGGGDDDPPPRLPRERRRAAASRRPQTTALGGCLRSVIIALTAAVLAATIFTWATPNDFIATNVRRGLSAAIATEAATAAPTAVETPNWLRRIGIVSGHRGPENDPGAVCPDGLTEAEINLSVAQRVVIFLQSRGYTVDLLDEFDPRLTGYQADALVSIHANTCQDFGERVSGFMISYPAARISARANDTQLVDCVARYYAESTQLERRMELTRDMTEYHTFSEIHSFTPAAIIELGFLRGDRELLTSQPDLMAGAISDGILCFLQPSALE
ncbi:MAG: N-acetylmuramoyl-L-alanine amidase [Chloroflexi bacterium]|nr:N-acetylmuramoyl-L-alanine amidase [Chloroflexota bacterium]